MEKQEEKQIEEKPLRPPYASSGQADSALDLFRRLVPKKIDNDFIANNNLATKTNAFRVMDFYKWLGIIDREGNVIQDVAEKLRLVGGDREEFIRKLIEKSYKELFESVNVLEAQKNDIINFFISNNGFTQIQSKFATALFIHLCQKYNIPISEEIKKKSYLSDRPKKEKKVKGAKNNKKDLGDEENSKFDIPDKGVMILVQSKDKSINKPFFAESASQLNEIYDKDLKKAIKGANLLYFGEE